MGAVRLNCPGCNHVLTASAARVCGQLVECPKCRLLFEPLARDMVGAGSNRPDVAENDWGADTGVIVRPSSSPFRFKKRRRGIRKAELFQMYIAGGAIILVAGALLGISVWRSGHKIPPPASSNAPPMILQPDEPIPAPAPPSHKPAEVEDNRDPPLKPVPRIDG